LANHFVVRSDHEDARGVDVSSRLVRIGLVHSRPGKILPFDSVLSAMSWKVFASEDFIAPFGA